MMNSVNQQKLALLMEDVPRCFPSISLAARNLLGETATLIETIGIPKEHADWFRSCAEVDVLTSAAGRYYSVGDVLCHISSAVRIGTNDFGDIVIDTAKSFVVDVDREMEQARMINTSLDAFLYFIARFEQSCRRKFSDAVEMEKECFAVDRVAMEDRGGVWRFTVQEAIAGTY